MFRAFFQKKQANYYLKPGYIYLASNPTIISTVLGSCVAVCVYDRKRKTGGMNHFQFPFTDQKDQATGRYGNVSICGLLQMLVNKKSKLKHLEAQIFGGASPHPPATADIGRQNISIARQVLNRKHIHIAAEDVGGQLGRKIIFNTRTNEISVLKVKKLRQEDWFPYQ
jgi:chemotaxis protein CheD